MMQDSYGMKGQTIDENNMGFLHAINLKRRERHKHGPQIARFIFVCFVPPCPPENRWLTLDDMKQHIPSIIYQKSGINSYPQVSHFPPSLLGILLETHHSFCRLGNLLKSLCLSHDKFRDCAVGWNADGDWYHS